jgi:serine/threonine protein kinase
MPSERTQRHIDRLLDEADKSMASRDWARVRQHAQDVLDLDPGNADALEFLAAMDRKSQEDDAEDELDRAPEPGASSRGKAQPTSLASGRYTVKRFLGEGGKKRVFLAHDTLLDRDVAFALIKTEGLDDAGRDRITREAQAMGRLGAHPHIVSVFDLGEEPARTPGEHDSAAGPREHEILRQLFIVTELMGGGDVEGLIEKAPDHRPPLERALEIGIQTCRGLEFAHSQGIVHRDLKPGNVWLTADGTAKIGDFGLAVAIDKTRLTQAGMMVGTVSYMPPEQATGGEVTPRCDLYSLGAMLYEMVTGRPPFVGDEAVAIIGQHLNTPPVAPSWHNPDCPPGLEALILRLLEKDPNKRPQSAEEVRKALESVSQPKGSRQPPAGVEPESSAQALLPIASENPLYRRVFVGREHELKQLQSAFDAALSGRGALAMVVGEPGIGKTAVCEQLATYVTLRGGFTLTGHCYEEGSLSLPYLAFVEALRGYVQTRQPEELRQELGSNASDLARIVSEVRERLAVEPRPPGDPEEDRWRLLQAVSGFLRNAAAVQPLLLVLEDLHWADQGTLDLLVHLSRNLQGTRLLVIGTYRDVEVDRSHPLSATLAELRRGAEFGRVLLRGLGTPEVQRMLEAITGGPVPGSLAESIHRQTEGNPLFVQEVVRYLVEEGHLGQGQRASALSSIAIPEGLRDVIGRRLSRLSPECNRVLAFGAVIGREFSLHSLRAVSPQPEDVLIAALEEATRVGVLEEEVRVAQVRYRFSHAFFRQTLYEELSAPRRIQMHQQIAGVLEQQYAARLEDHAAELAEHFAHSSDKADLAKAAGYGERAAQRAVAVNAYGEAVRHLERALDVQEVLDPDDQLSRCDLLLALGAVLGPAGEPQRVYRQAAAEAFALAEGRTDQQRASRACYLALNALQRYGTYVATQTPEFALWAKRADQTAPPGSAARVIADVALGRVFSSPGQVSQSRALLRHAVEVARELAEPETLYEAVAGTLTANRWSPEEFGEVARLAQQFSQPPSEGVSAYAAARVLRVAMFYLLAAADRPGMDRIDQQLQDIAGRSRDPFALLEPLMVDVVRATLDGDLERAVASGELVVARSEELGSPVLGLLERARLTWPALYYLGQTERTVHACDELFERSGLVGPAPVVRRRRLAAIYAGIEPGAEEELRSELRDMQGWIGDDFVIGVGWLTMLEASVALGDVTLARQLIPLLRPLAALPTSPYTGDLIAIGRHLGAAATSVGDFEQARAFYLTAADATKRIYHRPEHALCRFELAELQLAHYPEERPEAQAHLDFALGEFRAMKMQPLLERALRHKELLKA